MSILTTIDGMPVYSTIEEALAWAKRNEFREPYNSKPETAHVHRLVNGFGYMGGTIDMGKTITPSEPPSPPELPVPVPSPELPAPVPLPIVPQDVTDTGTDIINEGGY